MEIVWPSTPSLAAFLVIVIFVIGAAVFGTYKASAEDGPQIARQRALQLFAGLLVWNGAFGVFISTGAVLDNFMLAMPFLGLSNLAAVALATSPLGRRLATLPAAWLVGFQAFRLPLEVVLHSWGDQGSIPMTMTWSGSNLDVFAGIAALLAAPFAERRAVAWLFSVVGLGLLLNVMRVAVLSAPFPFSWGQEPPLLLPAFVPLYLIVPVCVAGALCGHLVLIRKLLSER